MARKLKDCKTIPPASDGVNQNFTILMIERFGSGLLWSFELQAPISQIMSGTDIRAAIEGDIDFWMLTEWNQPHNIEAIIKDNRAGINGESLSWEEIRELYA
jgi:hypothetical protein